MSPRFSGSNEWLRPSPRILSFLCKIGRHFSPTWVRDFEAERERITQALCGVVQRIEHHGSTAVPGLDAKPIIDIQISVAHLQPIGSYAPRLAALGYVHVPHADDAVCPFFHRPAEWPHSHHIHVVEWGGQEEQRTLAFRDYLREHSGLAREYASLKKRLAAVTDATDASAREAYAQAKSAFIEAVVQRAMLAGYPRP